jgi:hypothetical protein
MNTFLHLITHNKIIPRSWKGVCTVLRRFTAHYCLGIKKHQYVNNVDSTQYVLNCLFGEKKLPPSWSTVRGILALQQHYIKPTETKESLSS